MREGRVERPGMRAGVRMGEENGRRLGYEEEEEEEEGGNRELCFFFFFFWTSG